ncbi:AP endonuclease [Flavobacterium sp. JRM]|nr:AP endonuclease [Flavobacterium sp. JRM]
MKKFLKFSYVTILAGMFLTISCTKESLQEDPVNLAKNAKSVKTTKLTGGVKKLLIIGIDGCRGDALMGANTPNVHGLLSNSVYSLDALTESPTWSGNGWSTMLSGVTHLKHKVTDNSFLTPNFTTYPSFLKRLETYNSTLKTMSIVHWAPINTYIVDGIDVEKTLTTDLAVKNEVVSALTNDNPDALFMHFDDVDHAGHSNGFSLNVPQYKASIETTDAYIGEILTALKNRPNYANEDWLVIIAPDHGGIVTGSSGSHGGSSYEERNIFTIFNNKNFAANKIEKAADVTTSITGSFANFNSNSIYASTNNALYNFGTSSFTIECRVKTSGYTSDPSLVSNKNWASGKNRGFVISANTGGSWKVNIGDTQNRVDISGGVIKDGKWHHLTLVVDRAAKLVKTYQDGAFVGQATIINGFGSLTSGLPFAIGQDGTLAYPTNVNGNIAEVRVWNKALSEAAILNYTCSSITSSHPDYANLIGYWKGNTGSGNVFIDSSSNAISIPFANNPTWVSSTAPLKCGSTAETVVPKMVDIAYSSLEWFGVPINSAWSLDGRSWLPAAN